MEQEELRETVYSVYARPNEDGLVTHIFSDCFEQPEPTDIFIKSGQGDEFVHVGYYQTWTPENTYRYKIENGILVERTEEEIRQELEELSQLQTHQETDTEKIARLEQENINAQQLLTEMDLRLISMEMSGGTYHE